MTSQPTAVDLQSHTPDGTTVSCIIEAGRSNGVGEGGGVIFYTSQPNSATVLVQWKLVWNLSRYQTCQTLLRISELFESLLNGSRIYNFFWHGRNYFSLCSRRGAGVTWKILLVIDDKTSLSECSIIVMFNISDTTPIKGRLVFQQINYNDLHMGSAKLPPPPHKYGSYKPYFPQKGLLPSSKCISFCYM